MASNNDSRPIGVFDSGVGGLTVAKEISRILPNEKILYFGDSKRAPYGSLTSDTLKQYAFEIIEFFIRRDVKAIVIACNTISANIYGDILLQFSHTDIIFIDVITPAIGEICQVAKGDVSIFATLKTIESNKHKALINKQRHDLNVFGVACPELVPFIENGEFDKTKSFELVSKYTSGLEHCDTCVLGCTHFPILEEYFKMAMPSATIINPAVKTAEKLYHLLDEQCKFTPNTSSLSLNIEVYSSGDIEKFSKIASLIFGEHLTIKRGDYYE